MADSSLDFYLQGLSNQPEKVDNQSERFDKYRAHKGKKNVLINDALGRRDSRRSELFQRATDDDLAEIAIDMAVEAGTPKEQLDAEVKRHFEDLKLRREKEVGRLDRSSAGKSTAVSEGLEAGAGATSKGVMATAEQWGAMKAGQPYNLTYDQVKQKAAREGKLLRSQTDVVDYILGPDPAVETKKIADDIVARNPNTPLNILIESLGNSGGGKSPLASMVGLTKIGAPRRDPESGSIYSPLSWALQAGERGLTGGVAGTLTALSEIAGEQPLSMPPPDRKAEIGPGSIFGPLGAVLPSFEGPAVVYGIPVAQAVKNLSADDLPTILRTAAKFAYDSAATKAPQTHSDLMTYLQEVQRKYRARAMELAGPNATQEAVDEMYQRIAFEDLGPLSDSPVLAQFASEMLMGGVTGSAFSGIKKAVGAGVKAIPGSAGVLRTAEKGLRKATAGVRYLPEADDLELLAKYGDDPKKAAKAGTMADLMKMAPMEPARVSREFKKSIQPHFDTLRKVKDPVDKALLWNAANGTGDFKGLTKDQIVEVLPDNLKGAYDAHLAISEEHSLVRSITGSGRRWEGEDLLHPSQAELEHYAPHRKFNKGKREKFDLEMGQDQILAGSARKRKGEGDPVPDLAKQWEAEFREFIPKSEAAFELRRLKKYSSKHGFVETVTKQELDELGEIPRSEYVNQRLLTKEAETGVPWVEMGSRLDEVWTRLTGRPGVTKKGADITLMPEPLAKRVESLAPYFVERKIPAEKVRKAYDSFNESVMRPVQKIGRTMVTIPNPAFVARNFGGAFSLSYQSHGLKTIDPAYQDAVTGIVWMSSFAGDEVARAQKYTLKSGKEVTLGQIADIFDRVGIVNQLETRLVLDQYSKGPLAAASSKLDRAMEKIPLWASPLLGGQKVSKLSEDFQHALVALNFLEDTTDEGIAKMLRLQAKFGADYRQLGWMEKGFFKDAVFFYPWMRFVFPYYLKQLAENPKRLGDFLRVRSALEREWGANVPIMGPEGVQSHLEHSGFAAPESAQNPALKEVLRKYAKGGKLPDPSSHEFAMMVIENPHTMALPVMKMLEGSGKAAFDPDQSVYQALGPLWQWVIGYVSKTDVRGKPITDLGTFTAQTAGSVARPIQNMANIYKLFRDTGNLAPAEEWRMRYKMYRDFGPMAWGAEQALPGEGVGGAWSMAWPWASVYPVDPSKEIGHTSQKASELIKPRASDLSRRGMFE